MFYGEAMIDVLKHSGRIAWAGIGLSVGIVIFARPGIALTVSPTVTYDDLIATILTALGVILAALALFIGIIAFFGWVTFEKRIAQSAETFLERRFSPDDPRYIELLAEIKQDVRRQIEFGRNRDLPENENPFSEDSQ